MELDACIKERRTVRMFTLKPLNDHVLSEILDAARYAPSSGNVQNWRFIVIKDKHRKNAVANASGEENKWLHKAPVLIVVCSEVEDAKHLFGIRGEALYAIQNCAAAIQNTLLKAHSLGVASAWVGDFDEQTLRDLLDIGKNARPQAVLAFGYGKEDETPPREPIENLVYFETYGKRELPAGKKHSTPFANAIEHELEKIKQKLHGLVKK